MRVLRLILAFSLAALLCGSVSAEPSVSNALEAAALSAAQSRIASPDRFQAQSIRIVPAVADGVSFADASVRVLTAVGPNNAGMVRVELRIERGQQPARDYRATVRGRVLGPAVVTCKTLLHKAAIDREDLRIEEADLTRLPEPPLRSLDELRGLVPLRTLSSGRVLFAGLLQPEPLVRKGEPIELLYQAGGLRLTLQAVALNDAAAGDTAAARIASSGVRVSGTLAADGRLKVRHRIR